MPSVVEVKAILERPKMAVRRMNWADKNRGRNASPWCEWRTALEYEEGEAPGLILIAQWRGKFGPVLPKWNCGILLFDHRIYAMDYEPDLPHTNAKGAGRPLHNRRLDPPNVHEHTWSQDGYGYAEPINPPPESFQELWGLFCKRALIEVPGEFADPAPSQQDLLT